MGNMSSATLSNQRINRPNMVAIGTIVWLASELMFFAALFAMYFTLRAVNPDVWKIETELLNIPFSATNTTILVLSSVTAQLGVFAAERGDKERLRLWFIITFLMGAVFVGGQAFEYAELVHEFLFVLARSYVRPKMTHGLATSAVVTSYYWHFVDVVWIGLFATIYLVK